MHDMRLCVCVCVCDRIMQINFVFMKQISCHMMAVVLTPLGVWSLALANSSPTRDVRQRLRNGQSVPLVPDYTIVVCVHVFGQLCANSVCVGRMIIGWL